ncbi:MAG: pilus assembly protein PilP [Trichlorobacter sp.]|nr:pilus assembly protein PilP [Trichlorobacter sp.]
MKIPGQSVKNSGIFAVALLIGCCLSGSAFGKSEQNSKKPDKASEAPQQQETAEKEPASQYTAPAAKITFDFSSKKDPFKPYLADTPKSSAASSAKAASRSELPIHGVAVEQFKLIALVSDAAGNRAMVEDPSGNGYILRQGMTIGTDEAMVTRIDKNGVETVRYYFDDLGKKQKETVRIPMQREP